MTPTPTPSRLSQLRGLGVVVGLLALVLPRVADSASSSAGEEYLSTTEAAPPNILFLVDMETSMGDPCPGGGSDTGDTAAGSFSNPCIEDVANAIDLVTQHFDFARYGVIGTSDDSTYGDEFYPIVPLGSTHAEVSAALSSLSAHSASTKNLGEALATAASDYFSNTTSDDPDSDEDGDGYDYDFNRAAIEYYCQENHIIVITNQRPASDSGVASSYQSSLTTDVECTLAGRTSGTDTQCLYDNVVKKLYDSDFRADLSGTQNITVHTVGVGINGSSVAEELYGNASNVTSGDGVYAVAGDPDQILSYILYIMKDIRAGTYSRSTPVVSADGSFLIYTFYELAGDTDAGSQEGLALGQGHVRAYEIDSDPTSSTYGQVVYDNTNCGGDLSYSCGGALWDGGDLLVSRIVTNYDRQWDENDGIGYRDIYTWFEPAVSLTYNSFGSDAESDQFMPFDRRFVEAVASDNTVLDKIIDLDTDATTGCSTDAAKVYDFDKSGGCSAVDQDDVKSLVAFARGYNDAEFRYMNETRGRWRLGDSPHSIPVVVQARNNSYAIDPTYRRFLSGLEQAEADGDVPPIVLVAANDGMLHAFALENFDSTTDTEEGEELWAWIPGYILHREHDADWAGRLHDLMLYGRTFLFDGAPVVEDVWIDADGDGAKSCNSVPGDCEWRRVVVVQQGKGGPVTLALDITETDAPKFLWEQTDETDTNAVGYTTGRPVIGNVYDTSGSDPIDYWTAFWGSGRAVPHTSSTGDYEGHEGNIYMWALGDTDFVSSYGPAYQQASSTADYARGDNGHPEDSYGSSLQHDSDTHGHYENAYISAALTVVDVDSDGDVDTLYFPITTTYSPTDEGGSGPGDVADPGSTWMYKACIDTDDPGALTWIEFFDPVDDGGVTDGSGNSARPEVYYAATTSWLSDGSLGVYWGTGTPYSRLDSSPGYFFAMKDSAPGLCSDDYMTVMSDCGSSGVVTLDDGEGLTGDPIVYAGVVYFSTWVPESNRCDGGEGRIYGLNYEDCTQGLDTDGDAAVDTNDDLYVAHEDSYISGISVTDQGTLFYGISGADTDGTTDPVGQITAATDPFLGTETLAWMEVF
jgi:hypothetical protein